MSEPDPGKCEFNTRELLVRFELTLAADVKGISPVIERIMKLVEDMGCAQDKGFELETALREALANAIVHGCAEDPSKTVSVSVACDESRGMIIVVRDPGEGFDPAQLPSPVQGQQLLEDHGRGIYLINQLMDEVRFRGGGTEIWMRKS